MAKHVYLVKDSDDLVSHCHCKEAHITFPPQMGCPWCGCGWLFTCIECRKAFTFARGVEVNETWEETARRDLTNRWNAKPSKREVTSWVLAMQELLADVEVGKKYVCLDGAIIPADVDELDIEGWHSHHEFAFVPQVAALTDRSIIDNYLANREYWLKTAIDDDDDDDDEE